MGLVRDWMESMRSWVKQNPSLSTKNHEHIHGQETSQKNPLISPENKLSKGEMLTNRVLLVMRYGSVTKKISHVKPEDQKKAETQHKKDKPKPK